MDDPAPLAISVLDETPESPREAASVRRVFALTLAGSLLLLMPLLAVVVVFTRGGGEVSSTPMAEAARPFDLPGLNGGRLTQAAFAGRVVVVNVWASWCGPCREEAPVFQQMARNPSGAVFYGVVRLDEPAPARAFAQEYGLDYPHAVDNGTFARAHNVTVLPTTLIFAADGSFVGRVEGPVSEVRLRNLIEDAIALGGP